MVEIPVQQADIDKAKNTPALVKNRFGAEIIIDLYTAKRLAKNNEVEIIEENYSVKNIKKTKTEQVTPETPKKTADKQGQ